MDVIVFYGLLGVLVVDVMVCDLGVELVSDLVYGNFFGVLLIDLEIYYLEIIFGDSDVFVVIFELEILEGFVGFGVIVVVFGLLGDELFFDLIVFFLLGDVVCFMLVV